ncbi:MAG: ACP S-malonyltransferase [Pseudomonadales bacterium]|nr:ACP S-malonyltransferase [Pseudomonadales bacterium]
MNNSVAFVFPGQGSQSVGMLSELSDQYPVVKETFEQASAVFGRDMWALAQNGPAEELGLTEITQPIMLIAGVAAYRAWEAATDLRPGIMAGHSLGEYSAYVCSGAITLEQGVSLVKIRGELMRDACPGGQGRMAAIIGLDDEAIVACCKEAEQGQVVQAVNFNAPGQVVIAGHNDAVNRAIEICKAQGAKKAMALAVSVPCHSDLMKPASEELAKALQAADFSAPKIPVVNNVDAEIELDPVRIKEKLINQLYSPVLWVASMKRIVASGVSAAIECGPGKVLSGMNKRIERKLGVVSLQDPASFEKAIEMAKELS